MGVEEVGVVEHLAAAREASSSAAVRPVSTDPLAAAAGCTHELHDDEGTSLPRLGYQLEGRIVVDRFVWHPYSAIESQKTGGGGAPGEAAQRAQATADLRGMSVGAATRVRGGLSLPASRRSSRAFAAICGKGTRTVVNGTGSRLTTGMSL